MPKNSIYEQFRDIMDNYSADMIKLVGDSRTTVGKEAKAKIATLGDYRNHRESKNYRKGFKIKVDNTQLIKKVTVHNTQYQLTHLLEHGHAIRNGTGRLPGMTRAFPHWEETERVAIEDFEKRIVEGLQKLSNGR